MLFQINKKFSAACVSKLASIEANVIYLRLNLEARNKKDSISRKRRARTEEITAVWPLMHELKIDSVDSLKNFNKQMTEGDVDFNEEKKLQFVSNIQSLSFLIFLCNSSGVQRRLGIRT